MGYEVVVELDAEDAEVQKQADPLASWVMGHVRDWQDYRDTNYEQKWDRS